MKDNGPILISGAGVAGLCLALALVQRGHEAIVLEQTPELLEIGAGLQLSPNATLAIASLGLLDRLRAIAVEPEGKQVRLWSTGEAWPLFDLGPAAVSTYGFPYLMVHRGDLQRLLLDALTERAPGALRTGAKVVGMSQDASGVTVRIAGQEPIEGSILVGADGVHSAVRAAVVGESPAEFTGCMAWRGVIDASRLPPRLMSPIGVNWIGPGRHVITYPLRRGTLMNFVGVVERSDWRSESWTAAGTREDCAADFAGWHADVHALIDNIDVHYRWALLSRRPLDEWRLGRAVLMGDAAHPMLPFMAQGAAMAIEDAVVLARCVDMEDEAEAALARFVATRIERTNRCVLSADRQRHVFHNDQLADSADAERYVAEQWNEARVHERYDWLFAHNVLSSPVAAAR